MTEQLSDIGKRLKEFRSIMGVAPEEMAVKMGVGIDEYTAYEGGEKDFSFSFLYNAAGLFGIDIVDLISGESPRLTTAALVRNGQGYAISKRGAYEYKHLAFMFSNKKAEPFMVTAEPGKQKDEVITMHSHEGQEFNYMVSGTMELHLGEIVYEMNAGDSIYFDSGVPHGLKAVGTQPATFIAVVIK